MKDLKILFVLNLILLFSASSFAQNSFEKFRIDSTSIYDFRDTMLCGPEDSVFINYASSLGFDSDDSFAVANSYSDAFVDFHSDSIVEEIRRFSQFHKGHEVLYYGSIVIGRNNRIREIKGSWLDSLDLDDSVGVSEEVASGTALTYFDWSDSILMAWQDTSWENSLKLTTGDSNATWKPEGRLVYFDKYGTDANGPVLCWYFEGMVALDVDSSAEGYDIFVDAKEDSLYFGISTANKCSGDVGHCATLYNGAQANLQIDKVLTKYRLKNCSDNIRTKNGAANSAGRTKSWSLTGEVKSNTDNFGTSNQFATTVHWAANWTHDYFDNTFGLDGPTGQNGKVWIRANWTEGASYDRAFENYSLFFGNALGFRFATLDIVGHEFTHIITVQNQNLFGVGETGAIGEAISDIFGTAVERYAQGGVYDWDIMGDELGGNGVRNLEDGTAHSTFENANQGILKL